MGNFKQSTKENIINLCLSSNYIIKCKCKYTGYVTFHIANLTLDDEFYVGFPYDQVMDNVTHFVEVKQSLKQNKKRVESILNELKQKANKLFEN